MKKMLPIFVFLLLSTTCLLAQNVYKKKISVNEWVNQMVNCKEKIYNLDDTEIELDQSKDSLYTSERKEDTVKIVINCRVEMYNCKLPGSTFYVNNLVFKKHVSFMKCTMTNLNLYHCEFHKNVDLIWGNLGILFFSENEFYGEIKSYEAEISVLNFNNCNFRVNKIKSISYISINDPAEGYKNVLNLTCPNSSKRIDNLMMDSCKVISDSVIPIFQFFLSDFKTIVFQNTDFGKTILNFNACAVEKALTVVDCDINQPIGLENFSLPEKGTNFHWNQISKNGIAIFNKQFKEVYTASTDSQLVDLNQYNELISGYKQFYSMYRTRGDMESANMCYMAMKDIETKRLAYVYKQNKSLANYFNWGLNRFLKFFCKYGTSPIRALLISFWTILIFAGIYFFFDNEWDKINRDFVIKKFRALIMYMQTDKKLADYYKENHDQEFNSHKDFSEYLKSSSGKIPVYMIWLGKPFYRFATTRIMLTTFLFRKIELMHGDWNSLSGKKKVFLNLVTFIVILLFVVYALIAKAINSLFLSINTFSTLGFGKIPVRGLSKYLAILQGFIGWFLLSIFSVSLINQILQN